MTADLSRFPTASSTRSHGSRASDGGGTFWLADGQWNVTKLLDMSDSMRVALAKGRRLTCEELEELNFVLDMMVCRDFCTPVLLYRDSSLFRCQSLWHSNY